MKQGRKAKEPALRIYVDLPWDAAACMGTGAYSETMVRALAKAAPRSIITLIVPLGTPGRIRLPNVRYTSLPTTEGLTEGTRQIALPAFLSAVKADCLFAPASLLPAIKVCPTVATVHDLTFETHPEHYAPGLVDYLSRWFPSTLVAADQIVAISEPVKQDLLFRKRVDAQKVVIVEQPIRETFLEPLTEKEVEAELRALKVSGPYFFHVSNLAPHKNMEFGVRVFADYLKRHPEARHELLFAGGGFAPGAPPDLVALARTLGIGHRVRYVGKVSDASLKALYQRCDAFLFPSLAEGWGLPAVEARALGARVLASPNVPSTLPEERIPLELERWVLELEAPAEKRPLDKGPTFGEAGKRLLKVILEAIETCRVKSRPLPDAASGSGVKIRGDWHSPSGFGQAARGVFQALQAAQLAPVAVAVPKDAIQDKRLWPGEESFQRGAADLWIHHVPPEHFDLSLPGKHASFLFWETDRLPAEWPGVLSRLDEVWAPSTFVADVLKESGVRAPIQQVSPPVDTNLYSPGPRRAPAIDLPPGFDPSWTVILFVGTWDPRKRPDLLIRSFSRAFTEKDNALLLIKSYVTGDASRDREILKEWTARSMDGSAHVRSIPELLSSEAMADLFRFSTAFATASRGEGYCLPAVQALSTGKPVVAPGWSAFKDYPTLAVDYRLERIPREITLPGYSHDQRWAVVDEDDLARKLRWIHENREGVRLLGKKSRDWAIENAAMSVVGKRLKGRIEALLGKIARPRVLEVVR
jgi:glycosyltransferase involved in cell wall biosynthesis